MLINLYRWCRWIWNYTTMTIQYIYLYIYLNFQYLRLNHAIWVNLDMLAAKLTPSTNTYDPPQKMDKHFQSQSRRNHGSTNLRLGTLYSNVLAAFVIEPLGWRWRQRFDGGEIPPIQKHPKKWCLSWGQPLEICWVPAQLSFGILSILWIFVKNEIVHVHRFGK